MSEYKLNLRLRPELRERVEKAAAAQKLTRASLIRGALEIRLAEIETAAQEASRRGRKNRS